MAHTLDGEHMEWEFSAIVITSTLKGGFMNWDIVQGNWKQFAGKVQEKWGKLTDDQLEQIAGKRVELAGKIQEAYGISKDEAEKEIQDFEDQNEDL